MQPPAADSDRRRLQLIAVAAVLLAALLIGLFSLAQAKPRITGNNSVSPDVTLATLSPQSGPLCVATVSPPAQTVGIRLLASAAGTTRMTMSTRRADGKLLGVTRPQAFTRGASPILPLPRASGQQLTLCWRSTGPVKIVGNANGNLAADQVSTLGKRPVNGDISIEYMQAGSHSALAMIPTVFQRASLFRPSWVGPWTFWVVFLVALAVLLTGIWLLLAIGRSDFQLGKRVLLALAAIAFVNAALWALITPAFNTPDEYAHFTYVETLASGQLPDRTMTPAERGNAYQPSTVYASNAVATQIIQHDFNKEPWSKATEESFQQQYAAMRAGPDARYGKTPADVYTPLYYAPAVIAYRLAGKGNLFDRVLMVRLYSALLFALGVIFTALFVRELLPRFAWAAPVAALAVAFEPMAAHLGGGVTNDNLMLAACAAALWLGARVLKRGITFGSVFAVCLALVFAYAAKPTALGIAPALALAVLVAVWRSEQRWRSLGTCALAALAPVVILGVVYVVFGGGGSVAGSAASGAALRPVSASGYLSYLWQWYLPAIGPMDHYFGGLPPAYRVFFGGFLADFNALDTRFSDTFYAAAALLAAALFALSLRAVWVRRARLRSAWPIVAYPFLAVLGTALLVNTAGYFVWSGDGSIFAQGRYLFPALAVFGLYIATSAIGAGRRFAVPLASALVVALACTNIAGMIASLGRFYL